jgi:hypothetical protein
MKMDLKEIRFGGVDQTELIHDIVEWKNLVVP